MRAVHEFVKGLYSDNPIFRIVLGMCPTLAVTSSVKNGIGMGIAASFVLVASNLFISLVRNIVPNKIRIPIFIVIIAAFVSIVEMLMQAYSPDLHKALGIFVPLIVVNCIILGRAEAFASKNNVFYSVLDGLGMGIGFTLSLIVVSSIRELWGNGTLLGHLILPESYKPMMIMVLAPGAFMTLGYVLGFFQWIDLRNKKR